MKDPELGLQDYLWHRCPKTGFNAYFVAANQDQTVILQIVDGSSSNGTHRRNNITGNSALHEAALRGQVNAVSYMVALDLDLKLERNEAKLTPVQCVEAKLTDEPHYEEQRRLLAVCKELSSNSGAPEAQARVRVGKNMQLVLACLNAAYSKGCVICMQVSWPCKPVSIHWSIVSEHHTGLPPHYKSPFACSQV